MLTVSTAARYRNLTTLQRLLRDLKDVGVGAEDAERLRAMIAGASAAVESFCGRVFRREVVVVTIAGYGRNQMVLERTPIIGTPTILYDNSPVTDHVVESAAAGILYRRYGWDDLAQVGWGVERYFRQNQEDRLYVVTYTGGYLLPEDDYEAATLSVAAADKSLNDSASLLPLVAAGDIIETSGFATAANNGRWTVVSRTAAKIIVSEAGFVNELAGASGDPPRIACRTLPADVEDATVEVVKAAWLGRGRDPTIARKSVGDLDVQYRDGADPLMGAQGLPWTAVGKLTPWRRVRI